MDWSVHGGKSHAPRGKRKDRYFRKWYLFDTQTGEKHEFEIAQEVANFVGCGVTTVIIARKKRQCLKAVQSDRSQIKNDRSTRSRSPNKYS